MKAEIVHASARGFRNLCDGTSHGHAKYLHHQRSTCGHLNRKIKVMCSEIHRKVTCKHCLRLMKKGK